MAWGGNNGGNQGGPWGQKPTGPQRGGPGRNGGSGGGKPPKPPEFDELFKKGQERFKVIFGGGDGSAPPPRGQGFSGNNKRGLVLFFGALILAWLASGIYFVAADEQGVVLRFGEFHRTTPPGIGYHLPFPIETVETPRVTTVNRIEIGFISGNGRRASENGVPEESLMLTGDENIVDINFEVQWKISKAEDFLFNIRNPEQTVKAVSESAMREVIGKTPIATVLAEGKLLVEQATRSLIQDTLDSYDAGVEVVNVNLLKVDPPAEVIDAFRDVQTARADLETARNQAEAYRNDIIPRARGEAEKLVLDAEAYKQQVINRAKGEAARFRSVYEEYRLARDVTKKRMYLEAMEDILRGMNKMVVDSKGSGGVLPYLPLNEMKPKAKTEASQ